ncbi:ATP-binding cassette domain-containing protein [Candidatus Sumerlaeota bacterium]|nr:ATP-binding cassette domain-containing protein [Candidatus Sumerlaeota bacterium]
MIEVRRLSKSYGPIEAVREISFSATAGDILGFLGLNGAGKTTTMRILTGYMPPTRGEAVVAGHDVVRESQEVRRRIGYLPERVPLYYDMTVRGFLNFMHELKQYPRAKRKADVDRALELCGLTHVQGRLTGNLSRGYQQRTGLAQAVLGDPKVIVLDEPTVGLDPAQVVEIRKMIRGLAQDRTVILSTHILPEVSMICNKVVIINQGRIALEARMDELEAANPAARLTLTVQGPRNGLERIINDTPGVHGVELELAASRENCWTLHVDTRKDTDARGDIAQRLVNGGWKLLELRGAGAMLEERFLAATDNSRKEGAA